MNINPELLKILACPICKSDVRLESDQLTCVNCRMKYRIDNGIPVMLNEKEIHKAQERDQRKYFDREFSTYQKYRLENWRTSYIKRIFDALEIKSSLENRDDLYLDIGVGGSGYTVIEAAKKGVKSIGIDLSSVGMQQAKELAREQGVENLCQFVISSAEDLPFKERTFSKISSIAVLEHLSDDKQAIAEISRVITERGRIFITVPNTYKRLFFLFRFLSRINDKKVGHLRHYSEEELIGLFEDFGFHSTKVMYSGHLVKLAQLLLSKIFPSLCYGNSRLWWRLEGIDLGHGDVNTGLQISIVFSKGIRWKAS